MTSLRDLMRLEKLKRANETTDPVSSSSSIDTKIRSKEDENCSDEVTAKFENKKVRFASEPVAEYIEQDESNVFIEPKVIHEEYYIEDIEDTSPIEKNITDDSENEVDTNVRLSYNEPFNTDTIPIDRYFGSESALLASIKSAKEKWLKIAGLDSFEYSEQDESTSLINNVIVTSKPKTTTDINKAIQSKIEHTINKTSKDNIISSNFENTSGSSDIKVPVSNLPKAFFDDPNLDMHARGQNTREDAIEQLKKLNKMEKMILSQDIHETANINIEDDIDQDKSEANELLESLKNKNDKFSPNCKIVKKSKKNPSLVFVDHTCELDWRARNF